MKSETGLAGRSLVFVVELTLGSLLNGGEIHAFDKGVGESHAAGARADNHAQDVPRGSAAAARYGECIRRFFHLNLLYP